MVVKQPNQAAHWEDFAFDIGYGLDNIGIFSEDFGGDFLFDIADDLHKVGGFSEDFGGDFGFAMGSVWGNVGGFSGGLRRRLRLRHRLCLGQRRGPLQAGLAALLSCMPL